MIPTIAITVLWCLGLTVISQEGQLLYFIRKPFDDLQSDLEIYQERFDHFQKFDKSLVKAIKKKIIFTEFLLWLGKPLIHCITCMASVWGILISLYFNLTIPELIFNSIAASFIQTLIWKLYAHLD